MPIEHIEDWEKRVARQDAFWSCEIIDRPVVVASLHSPNPNYPAPKQKAWKNHRERWMDSEYLADLALHHAMNTQFLGDNLPHAWPNLGPEIFSAFFGCELQYGEETSWSIPCIKDWADAGKVTFSKDNFYWKKIEEMTDALLEIGRGRFYTGITDIHTGGDAIVAFRDPIEMNIDMLENVEHVKAMLERVNVAYFEAFDHYYNKLASAGQVITTWAGIASSKKWYVPSNDFSCMISKKMFDDVFLPGIAEECRFLESSIYHLDGPGALQHLDSLLEIKELNAIQWVYGDGHGPASNWMHIYKKIQNAGKAAQIWISADELDFFIENLRPEGIWLGIWGFRTLDEWQALMKKIEGWG